MKKATSPVKKLIISAGLLILPALSFAQYNWEFGINTGAANYLGDMGGKELTRRDFVSDIKMSQTRLTAGAFARYKINSMFWVRSSANWVRISGDDKLSSNAGRNGRNLNFRNDMYELYAQGQFVFYHIYDIQNNYKSPTSFDAYIGLGAGAVWHNPKASYNGDWVALRDLTTEGKRYTLATAIIPASAGFTFTFNKQYRIGMDLTWRTAFSDYLDDVSSRYVDPATLPNALAIELANRTDELPVSAAFAENYTPGNKRGDATHNDSYLTSTVDFSYVMRSKSYAGSRGSAFGKSKYDLKNRPDKFNGRGGKVRHTLIRKKRYVLF
jgi:hypothetical protein